jgi:hypothetical protein
MNTLCDWGCGKKSRYVIFDDNSTGSFKSCCCKFPSRCPGPPKLSWFETKESGQIPIDIMQDTEFSVFKNYFFHEEWYISNIIKWVEWGSNRVIRQQGFRVLPITDSLKPIKQWDRIIDPNFVINKSMYLSQPKGQSIIVIHIGDLP